MNIILAPRKGRSRLFFMRISQEDEMILATQARRLGFARVCDFVRHACDLRTTNLSNEAKDAKKKLPRVRQLEQGSPSREKGATQ